MTTFRQKKAQKVAGKSVSEIHAVTPPIRMTEARIKTAILKAWILLTPLSSFPTPRFSASPPCPTLPDTLFQ